MTNDRAHVIDELAAYIVDGLDATSAARVADHIAACQTCAQRATEYRAVAAALPLGLPPVPAPPDVWSSIAARIGRQPRHRWYRSVGWTAVTAVAAGLLIWNVALQRELWRYAEGPQVEKLARRPARLVILKGVAKPEASARIFAAVDGRSGHMAISGLEPSAKGRVYQLWFVGRDGSGWSAATFTVDSDRRAWVVISVPGPLDDMRAILVTEETAPGNSTPTGPALVEAREWR